MNEKIFKDRTKKLALQVIKMTETLPNTRAADIIGRQVLRSATSVGANYRAACRAKSTGDMIAKLAIVEEEGDEALYWFELLAEAKIIPTEPPAPLMKEADEIVAMAVASIKTMRAKK